MVKKVIRPRESVRPRGRPRSFDEAEAVRQATQVFWAKGYDGVTIDDLVDGMGVGRPSLYAIFGNKSTLFLRCLEDYGSRLGSLAGEALLSPSDVHGAIRGMLRFTVESATREESPSGCLMVCIAPLVDDERVRAYLVHVESQAMAAIEQRLRAGIEAGELPVDFPVGVRARQVMDLSRGLTLRARMGGSRADLLADADAGAALLLHSCRVLPEDNR